MRRLYLIRHAEPELAGRLLGQTDPGLTALGAQAASRWRDGLELAAIYTSPLRRAAETAGPGAIVIAEFAEIHYGEWEGCTWAEAEARNPAIARRKREDWFSVPAPGGEAWADFCARVSLGLERVLAGPLPAAIVAHLGVNAALHHLLRGGNPAAFQQRYCEVLTYEL